MTINHHQNNRGIVEGTCCTASGLTLVKSKFQTAKNNVMMVEGGRADVQTILSCFSPKLRAKYRAYCAMLQERRKRKMVTAMKLESIPENMEVFHEEEGAMTTVRQRKTSATKSCERTEPQKQITYEFGNDFGLGGGVDHDDASDDTWINWKRTRRDWILLFVLSITVTIGFAILFLKTVQ